MTLTLSLKILALKLFDTEIPGFPCLSPASGPAALLLFPSTWGGIAAPVSFGSRCGASESESAEAASLRGIAGGDIEALPTLAVFGIEPGPGAGRNIHPTLGTAS